MRLILIIKLIVIVALLSQCCLRKQTVVNYKTISIDFSEMYCGGAAPPDKMLQQMAELKPFANRDIQVFMDNKESKPQYYKTNDKGEIKLPTTILAQIFISIYSSAEVFKKNPEIYDCYKGFIKNNLLAIDMTTKDSLIKLTTVMQCNPCLPAAP